MKDENSCPHWRRWRTNKLYGTFEGDPCYEEKTAGHWQVGPLRRWAAEVWHKGGNEHTWNKTLSEGTASVKALRQEQADALVEQQGWGWWARRRAMGSEVMLEPFLKTPEERAFWDIPIVLFSELWLKGVREEEEPGLDTCCAPVVYHHLGAKHHARDDLRCSGLRISF